MFSLSTLRVFCISFTFFNHGGVCQLLVFCMYAKDSGSAFRIRESYLNLSIKSSRSKKSFIKDLRNVSSCQYYDSLVSLETVHFRKKLVDGLLSFIITHTDSLGPLSTYGIKFINKDNTWSILLGLSE